MVILLAASAIGFTSAIGAYQVHLRKLPIEPPNGRTTAAIPTETVSWERVGPDRVMSKDVVETLGTENYVSRLYRLKESPGDEPVVLEFHAAYYTGMIDTVPHVPERCFVGGGLQKGGSTDRLPMPMDTSQWVIDRTVEPEFAGESGVLYTARTDNRRSDAPGQRVRLPRDVTPDRPIRMMVSAFVDQQGQGRLYAGYFFVANGGTVASANDVRTLAFDLQSDYAFYLKVQVTSSTVSSKQELTEHAGSLIGELMPEIMRCVPDWVEVQRGVYPDDNPRNRG
ncbi:MAG: exosortase-associated EpsI family protein [Planctomycetota bacterium]